MLEATPGTKVTLNKGDPARLLQNDSSQTLTQLLIYPPSSYLLPNSCGLGTVLGIMSLKINETEPLSSGGPPPNGTLRK